jgi:pimeloyl-ACP methyl ester carboxylesterase
VFHLVGTVSGPLQSDTDLAPAWFPRHAAPVGALAARLARSGYCKHCIDFGGLFGRYNARPVEELAHIVAERVDQLVRDHPRERIVLVGHSLGGLIRRYYVQNLDGADRVRRLVTLGTRHRGTAWAYSGYLVGHVLPSLRQVVSGSRLLRDLADDRFPDGVRLTSMYSRRDPFCPPSGAAWRPAGHISRTSSWSAADIWRGASRTPLAPPTATEPTPSPARAA